MGLFSFVGDAFDWATDKAGDTFDFATDKGGDVLDWGFDKSLDAGQALLPIAAAFATGGASAGAEAYFGSAGGAQGGANPPDDDEGFIQWALGKFGDAWTWAMTPNAQGTAPWQQVVGYGAPAAGAYLSGKSFEKGAQIEADARLQQAEMQGQLARDLTATGLDYAKEQRDIALTGTEPYRNAGALALAGMMDMTALDRTQLPGVGGGIREGGMETMPGRTPPSAFERMRGGGGLFSGSRAPSSLDRFDLDTPAAAAGTTTGPTGTSMYTPEIDYDLDRLNDPTRILTGAPEYDFQADPSYQWRVDEGMRALENSAAAKGGLLSGGFARDAQTYGQGMASQEFGNIFNRLGAIAGFGPAAGGAQGGAPGAATQFGNPMIESMNAIGAAGMARGQGQVNIGNAWQNAFTQMGQFAGYSNTPQMPWAYGQGGQ